MTAKTTSRFLRFESSAEGFLPVRLRGVLLFLDRWVALGFEGGKSSKIESGESKIQSRIEPESRHRCSLLPLLAEH